MNVALHQKDLEHEERRTIPLSVDGASSQLPSPSGSPSGRSLLAGGEERSQWLLRGEAQCPRIPTKRFSGTWLDGHKKMKPAVGRYITGFHPRPRPSPSVSHPPFVCLRLGGGTTTTPIVLLTDHLISTFPCSPLFVSTSPDSHSIRLHKPAKSFPLSHLDT